MSAEPRPILDENRTATAASPRRARTVRGAALLCEVLVDEGVETIFGYPGGAVLPIYDELAKMRGSIRHVLVRHEQGAVHMAEGYARATGKVGVVLVTSGPGATNAVTGIANAYMDSTPLVVITGQVPRKLLGSDAFQEIDTVGITRPCTKYNYLVRDARELPRVLREAFHLARSGRPGPVLVDIPKDVSAELVAVAEDDDFAQPYRAREAAPAASIRRAIERVATAERPILYVGGGVVHANAAAELLAFAERFRLPVTPTLMGLGAFPAGHPQCLGMLGMHGTYAANMAISESDVIVAVGVRFDDRVTGALEKFAPFAEVIHVDVDPTVIHKNVRAHLPIVGDAREVLVQLLAESTSQEPEIAGERLAPWWERVREWQRVAPLSYERSDEVIRPQHLCEALREATPADTIVSTDVGQHQMWFAQYYPVEAPRLWLTSGGLGTMGFGLPAALGAKIAFRDRQVVAFVGDGGFQMTAQELATAVHYGLDVKVVVMNNGFLGMVRQWQELFYDREYSEVDMAGAPDFVRLAEAYGATGYRITNPSDLADGLRRALDTPGVVVVDVAVAAEDNVYPMIPPGAGLKEMVLK